MTFEQLDPRGGAADTVNKLVCVCGLFAVGPGELLVESDVGGGARHPLPLRRHQIPDLGGHLVSSSRERL